MDRWQMNWKAARARLPVGFKDMARLEGAFEAFTAKLPEGTQLIQMNPAEFEVLQARLFKAGIHDERGRALWYSVPVMPEASVPPGKVRCVR